MATPYTPILASIEPEDCHAYYDWLLYYKGMDRGDAAELVLTAPVDSERRLAYAKLMLRSWQDWRSTPPEFDFLPEGHV